MAQPVFRFAPSPNGRLHLGHAYSALLNQSMARAAGGRLLLRLEDTDQTRCTPAFATQILDDLAWLGLVWEQPVRVQSEHFADYDRALQQLFSSGLFRVYTNDDVIGCELGGVLKNVIAIAVGTLGAWLGG